MPDAARSSTGALKLFTRFVIDMLVLLKTSTRQGLNRGIEKKFTNKSRSNSEAITARKALSAETI